MRLGSCPLRVNCIIAGESALDHRLEGKQEEGGQGQWDTSCLTTLQFSGEKHPESESLMPHPHPIGSLLHFTSQSYGPFSCADSVPGSLIEQQGSH